MMRRYEKYIKSGGRIKQHKVQVKAWLIGKIYRQRVNKMHVGSQVLICSQAYLEALWDGFPGEGSHSSPSFLHHT